MATCKRCGASITWFRTERGKMMPIDVEGNGRPAVRDNANLLFKNGVVSVVKPGEGLHVSHFATCKAEAEAM